MRGAALDLRVRNSFMKILPTFRCVLLRPIFLVQNFTAIVGRAGAHWQTRVVRSGFGDMGGKKRKAPAHIGSCGCYPLCHMQEGWHVLIHRRADRLVKNTAKLKAPLCGAM